ncbi:MAG: hypothetical protein ACXW2Q_13240 [Thermoanaerobaculia bacterium]
MTRRVGIALFAIFLSIPAHAGFNDVLAGLESRLGRSMWIPFFGFARTFVRVGHPRGVHDVQIAVFEGKGSLDPAELDTLMRSRAGRDYAPLVRVRSRKQQESTFVYARPHGDLLELLVLTNDSDDTVLVRVVVDPNAAMRYLSDDPRSMARVAGR